MNCLSLLCLLLLLARECLLNDPLRDPFNELLEERGFACFLVESSSVSTSFLRPKAGHIVSGKNFNK